MDDSFIYISTFINNIYTHIFCIQRYIGCYFSVTLLSSIIPTAGKLKSLVYEIAPFFPNINGYFCNTNLSAILSFLIVALISSFFGHWIIQPSCKERRKKKSSLHGLPICKWVERPENLYKFKPSLPLEAVLYNDCVFNLEF